MDLENMDREQLRAVGRQVQLLLYPKGFICYDCKVEHPPMFMLTEEVWLSIAKKTEILCFPCAEKRLGRRVVWSDLKPKGNIYEEMVLALKIKEATECG